jgi:hypothetical protein
MSLKTISVGQGNRFSHNCAKRFGFEDLPLAGLKISGWQAVSPRPLDFDRAV